MVSRRVRPLIHAPLVYGVLLAYSVIAGLAVVVLGGSPTPWLLALLAAAGFFALGKAHPHLWDALPFATVAVMFWALSSLSNVASQHAHESDVISLDKTITGGVVLPQWLQAHIGTTGPFLFLGLALTFLYMLHFVTPVLTGAWLWWRHRTAFSTFVAAYILAMAVGFVIYMAFPTVPPWLASQHGDLGPIQRTVVSTLQHIGLGGLYSGGDPEPNGSMPSLHVTVPLIVALGLMNASRWSRKSWLWLLYPATLSFGVIYLGEHYLVDDIVGILLALVCFATTLKVHSWWERRAVALVGSKADEVPQPVGISDPV